MFFMLNILNLAKKGWNCTAYCNLILSLCSVGGSGTVTLLQRYSQWQPVTDVDTGLRTRQQLSSQVVILSTGRVLTAHSKNSNICLSHSFRWLKLVDVDQSWDRLQDARTCRPGMMTGWIIAEKSCHCGSWSDIKLETVFPYPDILTQLLSLNSRDNTAIKISSAVKTCREADETVDETNLFFTNQDNDNLAAFNGNQKRQRESGNTRVKEMNECPESPIW